jgi:hypothetical protein
VNRISNQDLEKRYFESFRKDYQLPLGTVTYGDRPDIIIEGQRRIGIEMTNFYLEEGSLPKSEQFQRKLRERVVSKAQSVYQVGNDKKIEITFGFDKENPIRDQEKLVGRLIELAKHIETWESGIIMRDTYTSIPELSFVYLYTEEHENTRWRIVQSYNVPVMSMDQLVDIVKNKEKKARQYKECDDYWLLIIIDCFDAAEEQEIRIEDFYKIRTMIFEKVIVYKPYSRHLVEYNMNNRVKGKPNSLRP